MVVLIYWKKINIVKKITEVLLDDVRRVGLEMNLDETRVPIWFSLPGCKTAS